MTGPEAIEHALKNLDLAKLERESRAIVQQKKVSKMPAAIGVLNVLEGLKRNELTPTDMLVSKVPVIPAAFRPYSMLGNSFVPGDANELYRDLFDLREAHKNARAMFGPEGSGNERLQLQDAVRALYGYGDAVKPKTLARGVSGFMRQITGCHDDETEILTRKYGWILFKDLPEDTLVATVNPLTRLFEWQQPTAYQHFRFIGEMVHFKVKNRIDALVTPNHDMWLKRRGKSKGSEEVDETYMLEGWAKEPAYRTAAFTGRGWFQTSALGWEGDFKGLPFKVDSVEAFAKIVGFYVAEGWPKRSDAVQIVQCPDTNPDICVEIRDAVTAAGFKFREETLECEAQGFNLLPHRQLRWTIYSKPLNDWLQKHCGKGSHTKKLSNEVKDWPVLLLSVMFKAYLQGDGNKRQSVPSQNRFATNKFRNEFTDSHDSFTTASVALQGDWSEVGAKLGLSIYRRQPSPSGADAHLYRNAIIGRWNAVVEGSTHAGIVDYDGYVHCCTVPNGLLITRRNTHVIVSGNSSPKLSFVQRKLLSKPQDSVARGVITIGAELGLDEIGIPEQSAWSMYAPYVQRGLVQAGMSLPDALKNVKEQTMHAKRILEREMKVRPVRYSRAPAWHKFSSIAGHPTIVPGDNIRINPFVTGGLNADFDGDQINLHVPSSPEAVKEAYEKLFPSKMLFSIKDQERAQALPKHEHILSLFTSNHKPSTKTHQFENRAAALKAINAGDVSFRDEVEFPDDVVLK